MKGITEHLFISDIILHDWEAHHESNATTQGAGVQFHCNFDHHKGRAWRYTYEVYETNILLYAATRVLGLGADGNYFRRLGSPHSIGENHPWQTLEKFGFLFFSLCVTLELCEKLSLVHFEYYTK